MTTCLIPPNYEYSENGKVAHCTKCKCHCLVYAEGFLIS